MGAGLGAHRHGGHAGELLEVVGEAVDQLQRALHGRDRLERVDVTEAGQPRHLLVEAGIVLHVQEPSGKSPVSMPKFFWLRRT